MGSWVTGKVDTALSPVCCEGDLQHWELHCVDSFAMQERLAFVLFTRVPCWKALGMFIIVERKEWLVGMLR